jgi:hypothetical protein
VELRADPGAPHQLVWGVWSACQRLTQSDEGRHNDQNIAELKWPTAADGEPPGVSAEDPVPKSPQPMREWAERQPPGDGVSCNRKPRRYGGRGRVPATPPGGQRPDAIGFHCAEWRVAWSCPVLLVDAHTPRGMWSDGLPSPIGGQECTSVHRERSSLRGNIKACRQRSTYSDPDESEQSSEASRARKTYGLSPMRLAGRPAELLHLVSAAGPTEGGGCQEPQVPCPCSVDFRQSR